MTSLYGVEVVEKFDVPNRNYKIALLENGKYTCNCMAWITQGNPRKDCKHIKAFKFENNIKQEQDQDDDDSSLF